MLVLIFMYLQISWFADLELHWEQLKGFLCWSWWSAGFVNFEAHWMQLKDFSFWSWFSCIFRSAEFADLQIWSHIKSFWMVFHFGLDFHVSSDKYVSGKTVNKKKYENIVLSFGYYHILFYTKCDYQIMNSWY